MKKNISILITSLSGGGAERVASILLKELKELYNITLVLMNDTIVYDIPIDHIDIIFLEKSLGHEKNFMKILKLPVLAWRYKKICISKNIDISLSLMYRPNFINIISKIFNLKSKIIISERNTPSRVYNDNSLGSKIGNLLIRVLYPRADLIIPNSKGSAIDLRNNYFIQNDKLKVIENPFDLNFISKSSDENFIFPDTTNFNFIMVGRLEKQKRHKLVIEAISQVKNANLLILGQGQLKEDLLSLIKKLNLIDRVKIMNFDKNPYKYMSKADCFILNSIREGFPNVLVEALACGLPVLSSDCHSGPREILSPKSNISKKLKNDIELAEYGILFPEDNLEFLILSIKKIMNDKVLYSNYKYKSKKRAQEFDIENIVDKFNKCFNVL